MLLEMVDSRLFVVLIAMTDVNTTTLRVVPLPLFIFTPFPVNLLLASFLLFSIIVLETATTSGLCYCI